MNYSPREVMQYIEEEDVKFIRLAFCDIYGNQKNISVMPGELERAFGVGIAIDADAVKGFVSDNSELLLHPEADTLACMPWRPEHGRVVRMFCTLQHADGSAVPFDTRGILKRTVEKALARGLFFTFDAEAPFYLFKRNENGEPTNQPLDNAGYMDIAPEDKGENVRREICLTMEKMGLSPRSSHHERGPGQNQIDFDAAEPLAAADNMMTFRTVVNTIAALNGLYASFAPVPPAGAPHNDMRISLTVRNSEGADVTPVAVARLSAVLPELVPFFGGNMPALQADVRTGANTVAKLCVPDPTCNIYLAYALLIEGALADGAEGAAFDMHAWLRETLPAPLAEAYRGGRR